MKGTSWHRLSRVHRDILIFTSSALKTWVLHVNTFIHGYYCIYRLWQPLTYLCFPYCISLIYFSFTKIRMFLYARIYWLAEFGDVSCLQFSYLKVETLTPTWEDFVGQFCPTILSDNFKREVRQNSVSDLRVWSLIHLEGSVHRLFRVQTWFTNMQQNSFICKIIICFEIRSIYPHLICYICCDFFRIFPRN